MKDKTYTNVTIEKLYKTLDKVRNNLENDELIHDEYSFTRSMTREGMIIPLFLKISKKTLYITTNLEKNTVDFEMDGQNIATLYKDNSDSTKDFIKQVNIESNKFEKIIDEMLVELDPPITKLIKDEIKKIKPFWKFW